ncbi:tetratricopeptide repeat protein [Micromonospora sp. NPDC050686]|uniref:tetratricopeptide repeat protein n=1 Tax=Micromonospora sp. NPDC050686 TaxID=3154631 RepID=UPI0033E8BE98
MTPEESDIVVRRAEFLCQLGRWTDAERALSGVLAADPEHHDALSRLTEVLQRLDRPQEAAEVAQRLIAAHPGEPAGHLALAEALAVQGNHADAEPHVRTALDLDPDAPIALRRLSDVLAHLPGRENDAVAAAQRAVALAPHDADALAAAGDALLISDGDGPGAETAYLTALTLAPENGSIRLRLGLARLHIGRLDDAADDFVAGLHQAPAVRHVRSVGLVLQQLGVPDRYAEVYSAVRAAMGRLATVDRTDPDVVERQLDMAVAWWDNGARAAALEMLELLVEANPNSVDGLAALAEYRFESGQLDDAEALARRALSVDPLAPAALFVLGLVCEGRDDSAGAVAWFDRLRALPVDAEDRDWMMESLINQGMAPRYPEMIAWYEETAPEAGAAANEPAPTAPPPTLPAGIATAGTATVAAPVRPALDGEPNGRLASIQAKLALLKRVAAEHHSSVVIEDPVLLERIPELPYGVVEAFSCFRRLEGSHLHVEQPADINSRTAWITRKLDPREPLGNPLVIGWVGERDPIRLDVRDGSVYLMDPDDYVFLYKHPYEPVEVDRVAGDIMTFVDDYLLGERYPRLTGSRRRDTWLRMLVTAGLAAPPPPTTARRT